jgi:cytochrome c biogenesis protein CcdA/thiol-disulfide isomerase/thioredoxin
MTLLLLFAFVSGLMTIASPCVWPLLPVVFASSTATSRAKPFGVCLGISLSFLLAMIGLSSLVRVAPFSVEIVRIGGVLILIVGGVALLIPRLAQTVEGWVSRGMNRVTPPWFTLLRRQKQAGFWGGVGLGFCLGLLWTPCAGLIVAVVASAVATQTLHPPLVIVALAFMIGLSVPLLLMAWGGQWLLRRRRLQPYLGVWQRVFGLLTIVTAILLYTGYEAVLQAKVKEYVPTYSALISQLERNSQLRQMLTSPTVHPSVVLPTQSAQETRLHMKRFGVAPELVGITNWLNTPTPFTLSQLRGQVVLVEFWTANCASCLVALPHVSQWYDRYHDQGFTVIGVHTPEFEFEKAPAVVEAAIRRFNIHYPIAQDNSYATWRAWQNQDWPAAYLVDSQGEVRRIHFGEGRYKEIEDAIRYLLREAKDTTHLSSI